MCVGLSVYNIYKLRDKMATLRFLSIHIYTRWWSMEEYNISMRLYVCLTLKSCSMDHEANCMYVGG